MINVIKNDNRSKKKIILQSNIKELYWHETQVYVLYVMDYFIMRILILC